MKKILFCFAVFAFALTGCDPFCVVDFKIINQTKSDIVVEVDGSGEFIINPDSEQRVYHWGDICNAGEKPSDSYFGQGGVMPRAEMTIDGKHIPDRIWRREYWEFTSRKQYAAYTLTVTEELIKSFEIESE